MAAGLSTTVTFNPLHRSFSSSSSVRLHHPRSLTGLPSSLRFRGFSVCYVVEEQRQSSPVDNDERLESSNAIDPELLALRLAEKLERKKSERKKSERFTYLIAAVMSSFGITSMAVLAVYYRFSWQMEQSHHKPREGPFELNDVFAIINAVPAISLLSYGFFNKGLVPGLCFGAGLGITVFGIAYMFVHDGLVHKRFPVGPIADVPYLRKVAAAHQV
ncbi:hypothetical protein F2Q70_00033086 [Brassica cretica]|uniref:beta-carotene 3-hydroxylase n=1 Tax=Brassica cretica TaxID=69181 RepID=A0A8S9FJC3_BRACR|nr:hypothetical protein F2Q70_00033086 [Brassica cretica]